MSTFFLFPDSGLNLLNGFDFFILIYFDWRDTENQQFVVFIFTSITSFVLFCFVIYYYCPLCALSVSIIFSFTLLVLLTKGAFLSNDPNQD